MNLARRMFLKATAMWAAFPWLKSASPSPELGHVYASAPSLDELRSSSKPRNFVSSFVTSDAIILDVTNGADPRLLFRDADVIMRIIQPMYRFQMQCHGEVHWYFMSDEVRVKVGIKNAEVPWEIHPRNKAAIAAGSVLDILAPIERALVIVRDHDALMYTHSLFGLKNLRFDGNPAGYTVRSFMKSADEEATGYRFSAEGFRASFVADCFLPLSQYGDDDTADAKEFRSRIDWEKEHDVWQDSCLGIDPNDIPRFLASGAIDEYTASHIRKGAFVSSHTRFVC